MEKDTNINKSKEWKQPNINVTTSINPNLWKLAKENNYPWSEALELGLQIMAADDLKLDYPNCKLLKKMQTFKKLYEETISKKEAQDILDGVVKDE